MRPRTLWLLAGAWTGVIYSTLYIARPVAEFLRERNWLALTVWAAVSLVAAALLVWARGQRPSPRSWGVLALGAVGFLIALRSVSPVEVKLHFIEYGVLGGLILLALQGGGVRWAPFKAVLLTGAAGWIDEGIQYLLPNRWYDLQDVVINVVAGALAVATMTLYSWSRRATQGTPADPPSDP